MRVEADFFSPSSMHHSSTLVRDEFIFGVGRVSIEFLSNPIRYSSYTVATTFFDIGRQLIDKSCTQRYCTGGWHDAVCLRLGDKLFVKIILTNSFN